MDKQIFEFQKNALLGNISGEPLCTQYKQAWRACGEDKEMLMRLALSQQSLPYLNHACYENLGLSKEYILANFSDYINGKMLFEDVEGVRGFTYEMYVGYAEQLHVRADVTSLMWCACEVIVPKTKCSRLYISNNSDVHLLLGGYNSPSVYLFDESRIVIESADKDSSVIVYKYSNRASVEISDKSLANVKVFDKSLRL